MTHQTERRKTWWLGLPPSSWITIITIMGTLAVAGVGGIVSYARAMDKIETNSEGRKDNKVEFTKQMKELKTDLTKQINKSETRTRSDIRELRQIMLNNK